MVGQSGKARPCGPRCGFESRTSRHYLKLLLSAKKLHILKDGGDASCNRPTTPFALQVGRGDELDGWYVMAFAVSVAGSNPVLVHVGVVGGSGNTRLAWRDCGFESRTVPTMGRICKNQTRSSVS